MYAGWGALTSHPAALAASSLLKERAVAKTPHPSARNSLHRRSAMPSGLEQPVMSTHRLGVVAGSMACAVTSAGSGSDLFRDAGENAT